MAEALLAVHALEAGYNPSLPIVRGVSIEVREGEIVSVLGPNGAGKSTLLKAIAGLVRITAGRVLLDERDITGLDTHRLVRARVAYVPQTENVFARLSVEDNLALGALHNQDRFDTLRQRVVALFPDLERLRSLAAGKLSGGQRQMVALGRAMMADPRLLMLDEPSAGLSPRLTRQLLTQLTRVRDSGMTIVMVEQNARAALSISDRAYVLVDGREEIQGDAESLLGDPALGALYLGAAPGTRSR
ncbi:MAG: ABC transporter ATP-binding protein [Immundisolibacterales bacterium]|nr:ABC transporter ATP-binding protein [Immundisolibacterales bacterium]